MTHKPMHPRRHLQQIIDESGQLIVDTQSWNDNCPNAPPIDCEESRVVLAIARKAAGQWDSGDVAGSIATMARLTAYAEGVRNG